VLYDKAHRGAGRSHPLMAVMEHISIMVKAHFLRNMGKARVQADFLASEDSCPATVGSLDGCARRGQVARVGMRDVLKY